MIISKFKKYIFGLWIVFSVVLSGLFVNSYQLIPVWLDKYASNWNSQFQLWVLKKSRFLSSYLWTAKSVLWLDNQKLIFWWPDNWLYVFTDEWQGYLDYYYSCDKIDINWTWDYLQNCWSQSVGGLNNDIISNFLGYVWSGDYVYVNLEKINRTCWQWCSSMYWFATVCFSSSWLNSTLCLYWNTYNYWSNYRPLTWSLNIPNTTNYWNLSLSYISEPPGFTFTPTPLPDWWEYYTSCPTVKQLISNYENKGFNSGMCYSSSKIYSWWQFVSVEPQSILTAFTDRDDFVNSV